MSEYQYYEFLAIDRPLTAREMAELRALSTRAHITPASFTNEYEWGDFKGDPAKLMRRYFDAHVYLASWANCCFSLRLPREVFEPKTILAFRAGHALFFQEAGEHWVIDWVLNESENYDRFGEDDGRSWMARLAPLREELLRGDLRALYIGWLAAVTSGEIGDSELEPPLPAGPGRMTPAQLALSEFLEVDPDLLVGVSAGSPGDFVQANSMQDTDAWIATLSQEDMREALRFMLTGQAGKVERSLKNRFAAWQRDRHSGAATPSPRRKVAEIRELADGARAVRLKRESEACARAEKRRREQREAHLAALAKDVELAWTTAHRRAERGTAAAYDDVTRAIADLAEAYALHATRGQFEQALRRFMAQHVRRGALVRRLVDAGLWRKE